MTLRTLSELFCDVCKKTKTDRVVHDPAAARAQPPLLTMQDLVNGRLDPAALRSVGNRHICGECINVASVVLKTRIPV